MTSRPPKFPPVALAVLALASLGCAAASAEDFPPPPAAAPAAAPGDAAARDAGVAEAVLRSGALRASGDFEGALAALESAQKAHGDDARLALESAWTFFGMMEREWGAGADKFLVKGLLADAHLRLDRAKKLDASVAGTEILLAKILRYEEDPDAAKRVLAEHLAKNPDDAAALREAADMAWTAQDWPEADRRYTRLAQIDPKDGDSRLRATISKQWLGVPVAQLEAGYLAAARLLPDQDKPLQLLAGLYPGRKEKRLAVLAKVIEENPKAVWARVWTAYVLRKEDPPDDARAMAVLREAAAIAPQNAAVRVNLAEMLEAEGKPNDAVLEYVAAVEFGPAGTMIAASNALDRLLNVAASSDGVPLELRDRAYDLLVAKNPAEGSYGNNAGLWYRDKGRDYAKSLKYYQASVRAAPDDQDFLNDCALIYLFHFPEQKDVSLPMFDKVVRLVEVDGLEPVRGYWDALENLCKYWYEKGDYAKVVAYAEKRADPKATLGGRPYPSFPAAKWGALAAAEIKKQGDGK